MTLPKETILRYAKIPAAGALFFSVVSWILVALAIFRVPWYCDYRKRTDKCSMYLDHDVVCTVSICERIKSGTPDTADWQVVFEYLWLMSFVTTAASTLLQGLFFWPLAIFGKVLNIIMVISYVLDFFSGFMKAIACFGTLSVSSKINRAYVSHTEGAIEVEMLSPALGLFSMILSFLSAMLLLVATDNRPKGGESYRRTIQEAQERLQRDERYSRSQSVFVPSGENAPVTRSSTEV